MTYITVICHNSLIGGFGSRETVDYTSILRIPACDIAKLWRTQPGSPKGFIPYARSSDRFGISISVRADTGGTRKDESAGVDTQVVGWYRVRRICPG